MLNEYERYNELPNENIACADGEIRGEINVDAIGGIIEKRLADRFDQEGKKKLYQERFDAFIKKS
jgi:hypothetical protein